MTAQTLRAWDLFLRISQIHIKGKIQLWPKIFACLAWLAWVGLRHSCFWLITSTTSGAPLLATNPSSKCQNVYNLWPEFELCKCATCLAHDWHCCKILWPSSSELIIICCFQNIEISHLTSGRPGLAKRSGCSLEACRGKILFVSQSPPIKACRGNIQFSPN